MTDEKPLSPLTEAGIQAWFNRFYGFKELDFAAEKLNAAVPHARWLKEVRLASQLSVTQVADRLRISRSAYAKLEMAEAEETITLKTLRKCAAALNCQLVYGLKSIDGKPFHRRIADSLLPLVGDVGKHVLPWVMQMKYFDPIVRRKLGWARNSQPESQWHAKTLAQIRATRVNSTAVVWPKK